MILSALLSMFFLFQTPLVTPPRPVETPKPTPAAIQADEPPVVTRHTARVGNRTLNYSVTTGFMSIRSAQTGETEARIFFMAYTLENPPANRPLMFSFNGGPGSASVWLHMGALGPKRVKMLDDGLMPPPPYEMEDNEATWLTETDLVFIDPVGTGYSRATKPEFAAKFFGLSGDIESIERVYTDVSRAFRALVVAAFSGRRKLRHDARFRFVESTFRTRHRLERNFAHLDRDEFPDDSFCRKQRFAARFDSSFLRDDRVVSQTAFARDAGEISQGSRRAKPKILR